MSNKLIMAVYELPMINVYERSVLLVLANRLNDKTGRCYPSMHTIAKEACCSERKAQEVIKKFVNLGYLLVKKNAGPRGCNLYEFSLLEEPSVPPHAVHPRTPCTPAQDAPPHVVRPRTAKQSTPHVTTLDPAQRADEPKENPKEPCQPGGEIIPQIVPKLNKVETNYVNAIRDRKSWVGPHVKPDLARRLTGSGHVTAEQCKAVGIQL
jgi:hypothetical protein